MAIKPWYTSRTLWLNIITSLIAILSLTEFSNVLPDNSTRYVLLAVAVLNIVLRAFTSQPLAGTPGVSQLNNKLGD